MSPGPENGPNLRYLPLHVHARRPLGPRGASSRPRSSPTSCTTGAGLRRADSTRPRRWHRRRSRRRWRGPRYLSRPRHGRASGRRSRRTRPSTATAPTTSSRSCARTSSSATFPALAPAAPSEPAGSPRSEPPEELTASERAAFVGVEWRAVGLEGDRLVVSTVLSRPLAESVEASFYLFGYRWDRPFAGMPKLRVEVGLLGHRVLDQDRRPRGARSTWCARCARSPCACRSPPSAARSAPS